jgi:hypothetical protein
LNALAQCSRIENNLYYSPDRTFLINQIQVECIVLDKPDYFAPVLTGNGNFELQQAFIACCFPAIHAAIRCRCDSFSKTVMAGQNAAASKARRYVPIAYAKIPRSDSSEDDPLIPA